MVPVASLLNPLKDDQHRDSSGYSSRYTPPSTPTSRPRSPLAPPPKKQKISKDAPVFARGKVHGYVRYPPCEEYGASLMAELKRFSIYPLGHIGEYHRHIPYNSDKKPFLERTGRGAFEVFQYTFRLPNEEKEYTVMWDYNIGLVRITPFFKCCRYAKTVPAKMLNTNPGLREICHSITGGALAAQGYWMPYEAAKAVTATFCYPIRYALVPLFGPSFLTTCIKPGEEGYGRMVIDPAVVQKCASESREYRDIASSEAPETPKSAPLDYRGELAKSYQRNNKPRALDNQRFDLGGGYYTSIDHSENYLPSPQSSSHWTVAHQPRTVTRPELLPPPRNIFPRNLPINHRHGAPPNSPTSSNSSNVSPKTKRHELPPLTGGDTTSSVLFGRTIYPTSQRAGSPLQNTKETRAAYLLMQMHFADTTLKEDYTSKRRRASN